MTERAQERANRRWLQRSVPGTIEVEYVDPPKSAQEHLNDAWKHLAEANAALSANRVELNRYKQEREIERDQQRFWRQVRRVVTGILLILWAIAHFGF